MKRPLILGTGTAVLIKMQSDRLLGGCWTSLVISKHLNRQSPLSYAAGGDSGERVAFTLPSVSLAAFLRRLLARSLLPSRNNQSAEQQEQDDDDDDDDDDEEEEEGEGRGRGGRLPRSALPPSVRKDTRNQLAGPPATTRDAPSRGPREEVRAVFMNQLVSESA